MATKKRPLLSPKVRVLLERALVEALKRYIDGKPKPQASKKKTPARKKQAARRPAKKRARNATRRRG